MHLRTCSGHRIFVGKLVTIMILIVAAFAIDAYAFGGRYRDEAIQQGNRFNYAVQRQLKKIEIG